MAGRTKLDMRIILEKAAELVDRNGLEQLSLNGLAEELNIKSPSLYNHFDGLEGLKQQLAIYGTEQLYAHLLPAVIGSKGDEAIHGLSRAYIDFAGIHPGLYEATNRIPDHSDENLQHVQKAVVKLVMQVLQSYQLEEEMAIHIVRGLRSILHGFASLKRTASFQLPVDLDKSIPIAIDIFIEGIHSRVQQQEE
ncbi:TetR/AcrR family transcriptional regulator [Planococcus salinarum]|uniref:TetR/AcrR family transcriptional regulator n=1 Tax=Planococcus salinarum TaxID=622695 RepID=UPI000E3E9217|nr:TetR/AcrR family transcriptional regulator [Planococcus salinarum]TAA72986.1 TetR/AcrR family transcriptional regulator [Planococcus salinarum]